MNSLILGIDFGTSKTLVSYFNPSIGQPVIITLGENGAASIPTTIYVEKDGSFLFGEDADDRMAFDRRRYARAFKMELGNPTPPVGFYDDKAKIYKEYSAQRLAKGFLAYVKKRCEKEEIRETVHRAIITCPVKFSPAQQAELKEAAQQAGFTEVRLVSEPEAAGYAFCKLNASNAFEDNALIVDWGGGTLDMAIVSRQGDKIVTHSNYTDGGTNMGGEAFDRLLRQHITRRLQNEFGIDISNDDEISQERYKRIACKAKERLSKSETCTVILPRKQDTAKIELTRSEFELLIAPYVGQAADMARKLCESIKETSLKPKTILLVGGTSLIPCIQKILEKATGLPCFLWSRRDRAVCEGAVWIGHESSREAQKERAKPESPPATLRYTLQLTSQEMRDGCVKVFTLNGVTFVEAIPAGICEEGWYKRLSGDQAKGLGNIDLIIKRIQRDGQDGSNWNKKLINAVSWPPETGHPLQPLFLAPGRV